MPRYPRGEFNIELYHKNQQDGLPTGQVTLHFGSLTDQDKGISYRLYDVIGHKEEKYIQREQKSHRNFTRLDLGADSEKTE